MKEATTRTCWAVIRHKRPHVNLDYGRRCRLLPREQQPDCGCDECLQIRLKREKQAGQ